jgi:hypothetical protein
MTLTRSVTVARLGSTSIPKPSYGTRAFERTLDRAVRICAILLTCLIYIYIYGSI